MSEPLIGQTCQAFASALASREPVPGGGGAAAMAGVLGTALCSMVANFTAGNKKYVGVESDIQRILCQAEEIRFQFLKLVDEDARAFAPLARAYAIPKDNPCRAEVLEKATLGACQAPISITRTSCKAIELLEEILDKGNTALLSDVGCGAWLCQAALQCAYLNVCVNTSALQNRETAEKIEQEMDRLLLLFSPRAQTIAAEVSRRLRKGK